MADNSKTRLQSCCSWFKTPSFYIYANYLCSQWGDWMWLFASGLYLVHLDDNKLLLAAIFGFTGGGCVLLFGGLIGEWVDRNTRLRVVRVTLFTQNTCVMLSAAAVGVALYLKAEEPVIWNSSIGTVLESTVVIFAILAQLASIGYKISIEKDWIVVVAKGNKSALANLNAVTRAIDLTAKILAPACVGLVMSHASLLASSVVIAGWNVVSVFLEYAVLMVVYRKVPELSRKKLRTAAPGVEEEEGEELQDMKNEAVNKKAACPEQEEGAVEAVNVEGQPLKEDLVESEIVKEENGPMSAPESTPEEVPVPQAEAEPLQGAKDEEKPKYGCCACFQTMIQPLVLLVQGWKTYARQRVVFAGLALAMLYMTVMGFDSVTTGYIYSTGMSAWGVGVSMALAGVTGIASTFLFTRLRRRVGLERTGLIAFNLEILCLTLAVASVWAPGSPFDIHFASHNRNNCSQDITANASSWGIQSGPLLVEIPMPPEAPPTVNDTDAGLRVRRASVDHLGSLDLSLEGLLSQRRKRETWNEGMTNEPQYSVVHPGKGDAPREVSEDSRIKCNDQYDGPNISIILFLIGIITSRTGLWLADLTVTQLLQENVVETERGVVNGVQNSLNMLLEMTKFILVMSAPHMETFGIHIILSFLFICIAGALFAKHSYRERGHLFHFEKCLCNNNMKNPQCAEECSVPECSKPAAPCPA